MKKAFVILVGTDRVVHKDCSFSSGIWRLTTSLSNARTWATRESAQRYLDEAYQREDVKNMDKRIVELTIVDNESRALLEQTFGTCHERDACQAYVHGDLDELRKLVNFIERNP